MRGIDQRNTSMSRAETWTETSGSQQRRVTRFYDGEGHVTGTMSVSKTVKRSGSAARKRAPYSYKQLSGQLMRAKTSGNVSRVLSKMRAKRMQLAAAKRQGDYDETEIAIAIHHAEAIERVAKKRKKHLQMEERAEIEEKNQEFEEQLDEASDPLGLFDSDKEENPRALTAEEIERLMDEVEEEMERLMKEAEESAAMDEVLDEMTELLSGDISPEDLEAVKKKHRAEEQRDIVKADMKYLKALFDKLSRDKADAAAGRSSAVGASLGSIVLNDSFSSQGHAAHAGAGSALLAGQTIATANVGTAVTTGSGGVDVLV